MTRRPVANGVLPAGEADQAGGVDEPFDLDGGAGLGGASGDRWSAVVGEELPQAGGGEPGWDGLESDAVDEQVDDGGVGPEGDWKPGSGRAEPELLPADGEVARGGNEAGELHG